MKKRFLILLTSIFVMVLPGCSWLIKSNVPEADIENTGWRQGEICSSYVASKIKSYQYQHEGVSVSVCPKFYGGKAILWGITPIPFLPNFFMFGEPPDRGDFAIQISIDSPRDVTHIDLSKIQVRLPQKEPLKPIIGRLVRRDEFFDILLQPTTVSHGKATYYIAYNVLKLDVKELIIDMGNLQVNDQTIELPSLQYHKDTQYHYLPFHME